MIKNAKINNANLLVCKAFVSAAGLASPMLTDTQNHVRKAMSEPPENAI